MEEFHLKKKVTIIGGSGTIGTILQESLREKYKLVILDRTKPKWAESYIPIDATNFNNLFEKVPKDTDVLINLLTIHTENDLDNIENFHEMTQLHFLASFYVLHTAVKLGIPKVVFASSNHTTDYYESEGISKLGREITTEDYPYSRGLYGVLKLASENIGHIMARENQLSIINLRIGSVHADEGADVKKDKRLQRTLLTHEDTVQLFDLAIESSVKFGTYYGVSDNPEKPWSTENAWKELGFVSKVNAMEVVEDE